MSYAQMYETDDSASKGAGVVVQTSAPVAETMQAAPPALPVAASAPVSGGVPPLPATALAMSEIVHELEFPITGPDGFEITHLTLKRLKGRDLKGVDPVKSDGKFGGVLKFVAAMNGLPASALDDLDAVDIIELTGKVSPFLSRGTGGTPSP